MLESLHLAQLGRMGEHARMLEILREDMSTACSWPGRSQRAWMRTGEANG
jgi:hypothetical protein